MFKKSHKRLRNENDKTEILAKTPPDSSDDPHPGSIGSGSLNRCLLRAVYVGVMDSVRTVAEVTEPTASGSGAYGRYRRDSANDTDDGRHPSSHPRRRAAVLTLDTV